MSGEALNNKTSVERWNLDDDDFNNNENVIDDEYSSLGIVYL